MDCNGVASDGCEVQTSASPMACGACNSPCSNNHVTSVLCTAGSCTSPCAAGYADCNGDLRADGCETPVSGDVANCGACGKVCGGTAGRGCTNGACNPTCDDGIKNQGEGDIDCGGPCQKCPVGRTCGAATDCRTGTCNGGRCTGVICQDGIGFPDLPLAGIGIGPTSIAVGDFNGDGKPDVAESNSESNTMSVFLGLAGGLLAPKVDYATDSGPSGIAVGDLNGDGKPDIVVANYRGNAVSVFINKGAGVFAPKQDYTYPGAPNAVAIGDLNGDGLPDLAIGGLPATTMLNAGSGTFMAPVAVAYGAGGYTIAIGDLNKDGKLDLVMTDTYGGLDPYLNQGGGAFTAETPLYGLDYPQSIAVADLNGDGAPDVVATNYGLSGSGTTASVFLNHGDGTLAYKVDYDVGNGPMGLVVAGLTGPGHADLALANEGSQSVSVLVNDGTGVFGNRFDIPVGVGASPIAAADFNGDGSLDLVVGNQQALGVLLNRGAGSFDRRTDYAIGGQAATQVVFGDLNGDGLTDLVTVNSTMFNNSADNVSVLLATAPRSFAAAVSYQTGSKPISIALGDLNGDGKLDIAVANYGGQSVSTLMNRGDGRFAPRTDYPVGEVIGGMVAADFDGDGRVDLASSGTTGFVVLMNRGQGAFSQQIVATNAITSYALPQALGVGDLNGDGRPDLARVELDPTFGHDQPAVAQVINQGGGSFALGYTAFLPTVPTSIIVADLSGNGNDGIIIGLQDSTISVGADSYPMPFTANALAVADVNGDGIPDLEASAYGSVGVFIASSPGRYLSRADYVTAGGAAVAATDLTGDGRADLIAAGAAAASVLPNVCLP
jgi:hypothetical protein